MAINLDDSRHAVKPFITLLVTARHAAGLTQRDLAERMGIVQSLLGGWESGRQVPTVMSVANWADALGYELAMLPKDAD